MISRPMKTPSPFHSLIVMQEGVYASGVIQPCKRSPSMQPLHKALVISWQRAGTEQGAKPRLMYY